MCDTHICGRCGFSFVSKFPQRTEDEGILCPRCYADWRGENAAVCANDPGWWN